ncbi:hypothetical protein PFISCL1PPCAC_23033, partial [Pristionchus fissidentatus]
DLRHSIYDLIHCLQVTLQELTEIKDQPEVAEEKSNDLVMTKEECREAALNSFNNSSSTVPATQPIDNQMNIQSNSIQDSPKSDHHDFAVKVEEDPFELINDIFFNFPADEIKDEETESITEQEGEGEENNHDPVDHLNSNSIGDQTADPFYDSDKMWTLDDAVGQEMTRQEIGQTLDKR